MYNLGPGSALFSQGVVFGLFHKFTDIAGAIVLFASSIRFVKNISMKTG